ncbi:uncharacterized protein LOC129778069 [Toxorhynchites rutilus septentrionalis]|uniref:uncharacterized protein LOC129778069 n=1 Tax=Toxorhynchites rutilus septentrionalis TaxID=329112 RepID=UPI00247847EB|nr:uncharacterized protein LOC129778069 [Toxorhynchites rutilus septentrionalis]
MVMRCGAPFCMQQPGCGASFYPFPQKKDIERRRLWIERLSVPEDEWSSSKLIACDRHFSGAQFTKTAKGKHLSRGAVPDQFVVAVEIDSCKVLHNVCRFCLETSDNRMESICHYQNKPEIPTVREIYQIFGIEINPDDKIPQLICVTCLSKINYIKRIRSQFRANDLKLRQMFLVGNAPTASKRDYEVATENSATCSTVKSVSPDVSNENTIALELVTDTDFQDEQITIIKRLTDEGDTGESDDELNQNTQLITADQLTIMAEEVEIENIDIKNEHSEDDNGDDNDPHSLFTSEIEPPNDDYMRKLPTIEEFGALDDSQSDEEEISPGKKHRTYRPFRYTKRRRDDGVQN